MKRYHPDGDLAPRDVVARSIARESERTRAPVFLTLAHLSLRVRDRFPTISDMCRQVGLDLASDPIPVGPAAHYLMGGVDTDDCGRTSLRGLYAAGETACTGVHGANRLASKLLARGPRLRRARSRRDAAASADGRDESGSACASRPRAPSPVPRHGPSRYGGRARLDVARGGRVPNSRGTTGSGRPSRCGVRHREPRGGRAAGIGCGRLAPLQPADCCPPNRGGRAWARRKPRRPLPHGLPRARRSTLESPSCRRVG